MEINVLSKNKEIISKIVSDRFSLCKESLKTFNKLLIEPDIDDVYSNMVGDDLRARYVIPRENYEFIDKGWKKFLKFKNFVKRYNVTYSNFINNSVTKDKNSFKLFKLFQKFYMDENNLDLLIDDLEESSFVSSFVSDKPALVAIKKDIIRKIFENIGAVKLRNTKIEIVLSLNYADWFLCSTAESWSSCLNLSSSCEEAFWTGLPGLIGDKNRALIYITDGIKKTYQGITVDRILSRSWVLLDKRDNFNTVKFYPNKIIDRKVISKIINKKVNFLKEGFESKYTLNLLYHSNDVSSFIYQDNTTFSNYRSIIHNFRSGNFYFKKGNPVRKVGSCFYIDGGLPFVIKNNSNIVAANGIDESNIHCYICDMCLEDESIVCRDLNGNIICEMCFDENFVYCDNCNETIRIREAHFVDGEAFCCNCFDDRFIVCEICDEIKLKEDFTKCDNICDNCYENKKEKEVAVE